MNILITGGTGFIGRNLTEYLSPKHKVFAPTHEELELLDDSAVNGYFNKYRFDFVIHGAVRPGHRNTKNSCGQLDTNLRMFFNIIRNNDKFGRLIFLSSGAVYGVSRPLVKIKEEHLGELIPKDEHGFSKYIIARYIERIDNAVELRVFGIFGKYEDYAIRFISNAICKTICGLPITVKENRKLDYIYIDDLMPVIDYFVSTPNPRFKAYNITPDQSIEIKELAKKVKLITGKGVPIIVNEKSLGVEYGGDNSRLKAEITDLRFTPIDTAIKKLNEWYLENQHLINKELLLSDK